MHFARVDEDDDKAGLMYLFLHKKIRTTQFVINIL